jgi:hypothetical protein
MASTFLCILDISITTCSHFKFQRCNDHMLHRFASAAAIAQAKAAQRITGGGHKV